VHQDDLVPHARLVSAEWARPDVQPHVPWSRLTLTLSLSYAMSPFSRLRSALVSALNPQGFQAVEQELFDQLVSNKQHILDLYHVGPQNPQERQELESGTSYSSLLDALLTLNR
jgi:hypothetical protein